ncbi:MAG TPA: class I SAM-dependent methyltransferase [Dissulfurispiraceae bacterium]
MKNTDDINRGYVDFIKVISRASQGAGGGFIKAFLKIPLRVLKSSIMLLFIPLLFLYGAVLIFSLKLRLALAGHNRDRSKAHREALHYIPEFIAQYPMHLYPIVAKAIEMSFLKDHMAKVLSEVKGGIVELAVGDGSLSRRIFPEDSKVTALDLNPYSLTHVRACGHVSKRIVADCLNPPIADNGASFIVCNNLLHHVSGKESTIENWACIAPYALFNENTVYWASGWARPYLLKLAGLNGPAEKEAKKIELLSLQSLWTADRLRAAVGKHYEVLEEETFMSERVFFLSAVCSSLLFCYGPPTPEFQKKILNGPLRPITRYMTYHMAKALIEYDSILPRDKDSFVSWVVRSKLTKRDYVPDAVALVCPDCRTHLQGDTCSSCKRVFEERDEMLFLLPKELAEEIKYTPSIAGVLGKEHL